MHTYKLNYSIYNMIVCLIVGVIVFRKINIKSIKKKELLISLLIGAYTDTLLISVSTVRFTEIINSIVIYINRGFINQIIPSAFSVLSFPAIVFTIYYFITRHYPKVVKEAKTLDKIEKKYLIIVGVISLVLVSFTSIYSTAFLDTTNKGEAIVDVIYTSDNGTIYGRDAWFNIAHSENDIRQPLFGVFSLPFSIPAHIISELLFFIPKDISYGVVLSIIQFLLLAITVIMIGRLLKLKDYQKILLYLFFSLSFPYILFGLLIEQYVVALFYLILTIYQYFKLKDNINYSYIGAVSSLITSGILFPLINKFKDIKTTLSNYLNCFLIFITIYILGGQFDQIITLSDKMNYLMTNFANKQTFIEKLYKYTYFVESIFKVNTGYLDKYLGYDVYRMPNATAISIFGVVILGILLISFILNRKEKLAIISFLWVIFSFIILCIVGWGTVENGLILYSLYFSWAFYILFYLLIKKLFKNKKLFIIIMSLIIIVMFIFTSRELLNILEFSLKYFRR